jgi:hypothetical protein
MSSFISGGTYTDRSLVVSNLPSSDAERQMRHCYLCDESIPDSGFRRTVGTGRSSRISFGRRVSTSSTTRAGLRTLCAACAGRVDADEALKNKVIGVVLVLFVGFVIYANTGGSKAVDQQPDPQPATQQASTPVQGQLQPQEGASQPEPSPAVPVVATAEAAPVSPAPVAAARAAITLPSWRSAAAIRWKHRSSAGTRWSLRQLKAGGMALLIDIGGNQVATVLVQPEFQNLDPATMDQRVEYVRSEVVKVSATSAAYSYDRTGTVTPYP